MTDNVSARRSGLDPELLLPPNWAELSPLVDAVLDAPREKRDAILDALSEGKPDRRAELKKLVDDCDREMPLLNRPAAERFAELFSDADEVHLPGILGDRYRVEREVGRGGMARVFLAHDTKHGREVAVKIIREDVAASLGSGRFLQEIDIAARLRHPNIVPMYDSGETDGVLYFVMPYEEGPSLRDRIRKDPPLSLVERLSILRDVARALAYAHERGVVHRDIKPDNVLLSGGAAVVSDFGIAKALSAAQAEAPSGIITEAGARIGTPTYMAPEQAVGDPTTDHRADIYSFGCLAYELFAGKPPFDHTTTHELIAAHVATRPAPILDVCASVPLPVAKLIMHCLEKRPAERPQSAIGLLTLLEEGQRVGNNPPPDRFTFPGARVALMTALAVSLISGAAYLLTRRAAANSAAPRELTVAVLPMQNGGDSLERELAYGLSDEIATALVQVPGVRVMSRRTVATSREKQDVDPEHTGRALGAQFLVEESLRETGGRLTVLARLVQAKDGALLWANQYDRNLDGLAEVRDDIAKSVGDSLRRKSGNAERFKPARPAHVPVAEAYRLYVLGQRGLILRGLSINASADLFRRATKVDSLYAEAFGGLSLALALAPHFSPVSSTQVALPAIAAAERALRLDPSLAQPHVALGIVYGHAYRWERATDELRAGVRLRDSSDVEPLVQYGRLLLFRGQTDQGLKQFLLARHTEPASALVRSWLSYAYYLQGHLDSAIVENKRAFESDSMNLTTLALGTLVLLKARNIRGARNYARRLPRYQTSTFYFLSSTGDSAEARTRIQELERQHSPPWLVESSRAFSMLGARDTAEAIGAFQRATDAHDIWPSVNPVQDPIFDPVRSDPRFQRLLHRVGLR